jgi:uncharacterized protein
VKIWIDLANSPHPLLFAPISRAFEELGHDVRVTARDAAQTFELARERWPDVEVVGGPSPSNRAVKGAAIARRVVDLGRWARRVRPAIALSHNSYAQIVAARAVGVPAVTAMDFEHQPANHVAFRLARRILLPSALPAEATRRQGAVPRKVRRYEGLKEELYLGDFEPDPTVLARLGIERARRVLVVLRAPPSRALYHRAANPVWPSLLEDLAARPGVVAVVLVRHPEQREQIERLGLVCPGHAVDARSLMYEADLVIGAGGTMTREAALLGLPTVSVYSGPSPALDRWLEGRGLLRRVDDLAALGAIMPRAYPPRPVQELRTRGVGLVRFFVAETLGLVA